MPSHQVTICVLEDNRIVVFDAPEVGANDVEGIQEVHEGVLASLKAMGLPELGVEIHYMDFDNPVEKLPDDPELFKIRDNLINVERGRFFTHEEFDSLTGMRVPGFLQDSHSSLTEVIYEEDQPGGNKMIIKGRPESALTHLEDFQ